MSPGNSKVWVTFKVCLVGDGECMYFTAKMGACTMTMSPFNSSGFSERALS